MTDEKPDDTKLAAAELEAAREAAEAIAEASDGSEAKVRRPRARTSGAAVAPPPSSDAAATAAEGRSSAAAQRDTVQAEALRIVRGSIAEASARTVEVRQGGIGRLEAEEVFVSQGGIGAARGERVGVELGGIGAALARELRVTQGVAGTVVTRSATLEQTLVRTVVAGEVRAERPVGVLVMLAGRVSGDIRPVLDWRGALAFGAAAGLVVALVGRARRAG